MPFTASHVIAVLPFKNHVRIDIFIALCIGAICPDIALLFPFFDYSYAHSLKGVVGFSLPYGLALFLITKYSGIQYIQHVYYRAFFSKAPPAENVYLSHWVLLLTAIIFGALTHIVWDAFTHKGGYGVTNYPVLALQLNFNNFQLPIYKLLQYGSSILGVIVLSCYLIARLVKDSAVCDLNINYLKIFQIVIFLGFPVIVYTVLGLINELEFKMLIGYIIKKALASYAVLFLTLSVLFKIKTNSK